MSGDPRSMSADGWLVRAEYVFIEGAPSIDEIDELVGGRVEHAGGGVRHNLPGQAERTHVEWEFASFADARAAITRLDGVRGIDDPQMGPSDRNRARNSPSYDVRRADVRGGRVRCPDCRARIPDSEETLDALQGVKDGEEIVLRCAPCGLAMTWWLLPDS